MNCYTDSDARQPRSLALRLTLPSVPQALLAGVVTDHPLPARATETAVLEVPGLVLGAISPVTRHRALLTSFAWACGAPALAFSPLGSGMPPNGLERQIPVLGRAEDMAWCTMEQTFYFLEAKILEHSD